MTQDELPDDRAQREEVEDDITSAIDVKSFCADENGLYRVAEPWVAGGFEYAANGAIAIRRPTDKQDTKAPKHQRLANYAPTFEGYNHADAVDELPPLNGDMTTRPCEHDYPGACETCNGTGQCQCMFCDADHECGHCDGTGHVEFGGPHPEDCICGGAKGVRVPGLQEIGAAKFAGRYIEKVLALPGVKIATPTEPMGHLYFTADGSVEGLLAAMRVTDYPES